MASSNDASLCAGTPLAKTGKNEGQHSTTTYDAKHPEVMKRLPAWISDQLQITPCRAIDKDMLDLVNLDISRGLGIAAAADRIKAIVNAQHTRNHLAYLQFNAALQQPGTPSPACLVRCRCISLAERIKGRCSQASAFSQEVRL